MVANNVGSVDVLSCLPPFDKLPCCSCALLDSPLTSTAAFLAFGDEVATLSLKKKFSGEAEDGRRNYLDMIDRYDLC